MEVILFAIFPPRSFGMSKFIRMKSTIVNSIV